MSNLLRVVQKSRYDEQTYVSIPTPKGPLGKSSIRIQTRLVGLSNNNLSYCLAGTFLHWWDAFPVPKTAPSPYNDLSEYGIAPGWGYASVIDSTIDGISVGRIMYGFLPISSHVVDLVLEPAQVLHHWIEISPHRSKVMSMYQRYEIMPEGFDPNTSKAAWRAALIRCEAGMTLAKYVFPQDGSEAIDPFGPPVSSWTPTKADLTDTCLVSIASGTKTAKTFIWHLADIAQHKTPEFSLVEVTSGAGCGSYLKSVPFNHKVTPYELISSPDCFPLHRKFILLNFGGRGNTLGEVHDTIRHSYPEAELIVVQIGSEPKVGTPESTLKRRELLARLQAAQMNTTGIRDEAVKLYGEQQYFEALNGDFETLINEQTSHFNGKVLGLTMKVSQGLQGDTGVDGIWERMCRGQLSTIEGIAVRL